MENIEFFFDLLLITSTMTLSKIPVALAIISM